MKEKITTIFWDAGNVLFPDAHLWFLGGSVYEPVLKLLGINPEESEKTFSERGLHGLWFGKMTEDEYWRDYINKSPKKPTVRQVKRSYRQCVQASQELFEIIRKLAKDFDQYIVTAKQISGFHFKQIGIKKNLEFDLRLLYL